MFTQATDNTCKYKRVEKKMIWPSRHRVAYISFKAPAKSFITCKADS